MYHVCRLNCSSAKTDLFGIAKLFAVLLIDLKSKINVRKLSAYSQDKVCLISSLEMRRRRLSFSET